MKRGTPNHPKIMELAGALHIRRYEAVGLMECLWHWAAKYTPAGDLGKYSNATITQEIGWPEDAAGDLIQALVDIGWVDTSDEHRLVLHDWPQHCEDAVHLNLARQGRYFATGEKPRITRATKAERRTIEAKYTQAHGKRTESALQAHGKRPASAEALALAEALPKPLPLPGHSLAEAEPKPNGAPRQRGGNPKRAGKMLSDFGFGALTPETLNERIREVSHDGPEWTVWFEAVLDALYKGDVLLDAEEIVKYAEDCADPDIRRVKDMGKLKAPSKFIVSKILKLARSNKIKLPDHPAHDNALQGGKARTR